MTMVVNPSRFASAVPGGDPYWDSVVSLIHFDGADGSTAITDEKGNVWTVGGTPVISTAAAIIGSAAGRITTGNSYWQTAHDPKFSIDESEPLTLEFRFRSTAVSKRLFAKKPTTNTSGFTFAVNSTASTSFLVYTAGGVSRNIGGTVTLSLGTAYAMSLTFDGFNWRTFLDGILVNTVPAWGDLPVGYGGVFRVGLDPFNTGTAWRGDVDEFRLTRGVCRYTSDYTVDTTPFPNF